MLVCVSFRVMPPRRAKSPGKVFFGVSKPLIPILPGIAVGAVAVSMKSPKLSERKSAKPAGPFSGGSDSKKRKSRGGSRALREDDDDDDDEEAEDEEEVEEEEMQVVSVKKPASGGSGGKSKKARGSGLSPAPQAPQVPDLGFGRKTEMVVTAAAGGFREPENEEDRSPDPIPQRSQAESRPRSTSPPRRRPAATPKPKPRAEIYSGLTPSGSSGASPPLRTAAATTFSAAPQHSQRPRRSSGAHVEAPAQAALVAAPLPRVSRPVSSPSLTPIYTVDDSSSSDGEEDGAEQNDSDSPQSAVAAFFLSHGDHIVVAAVLGVLILLVASAFAVGDHSEWVRSSSTRLLERIVPRLWLPSKTVVITFTAMFGTAALVRSEAFQRHQHEYAEIALGLGGWVLDTLKFVFQGLAMAAWWIVSNVWQGTKNVFRGRGEGLGDTGRGFARPVAPGGGRHSAALTPSRAASSPVRETNRNGNYVRFAPPLATTPAAPPSMTSPATGGGARSWMSTADRAPTPFVKVRDAVAGAGAGAGAGGAANYSQPGFGTKVFEWLGPVHAGLVVLDVLLFTACSGMLWLSQRDHRSPWLLPLAALLLFLHPSVTLWRMRSRESGRRAALVELVVDAVKDRLRQHPGKDYPVEHMEADLADAHKYSKWPPRFREGVSEFGGERVDICKLSKREFQALWPLAYAELLKDHRVQMSHKKIAGMGRETDCFYMERVDAVGSSSGLAGTNRASPAGSSIPYTLKAPVPVQVQSGGFLSFGR